MISYNKFLSLKSFLLIFLVINISGYVSAKAEIYTKKIIASGRAVKLVGYEDQTEDMALEAALYQAALQAGSSVEGYSSSSNGNLVDEQTFIRTDARIMDYAILSMEDDGESVTVTIEAVAATNIMENIISGRSTSDQAKHIENFDKDSIFFFPSKRKYTKPSCMKLASIHLHLIKPKYNISLNVPDWSLGMPTKISDAFYKVLGRNEGIFIKDQNFVRSVSETGLNQNYNYSNLAYMSETPKPNEFYLAFSVEIDGSQNGKILKKKFVNITVDVTILNSDRSEILYEKSVSHKINRGFGIGWSHADALLKKRKHDSDKDIYRILDWLVKDIRAEVGCLPRIVPIQESGSFYRTNIGFDDGVQTGDLAVINNHSVKGGDITPWIIIVAESVESNFTNWRLLDPSKKILVGKKSLAKLIN